MCNDRKQISGSLGIGLVGAGGEVRQGDEEKAGRGRRHNHKGAQKNWGVMDMLIILIMVMVSRVNIYVKINQIEHFKYVQLL